METVALPDLAPILAAVLGPVLVFVIASMRYQHVDGTKTRALIVTVSNENRDLIEAASTKNRDLIEAAGKENRDLIEAAGKENRDLIEKVRADLSDSIGDVRERLARIEGFMEAWPPDHKGPEEGTAEAA